MYDVAPRYSISAIAIRIRSVGDLHRVATYIIAVSRQEMLDVMPVDRRPPVETKTTTDWG